MNRMRGNRNKRRCEPWFSVIFIAILSVTGLVPVVPGGLRDTILHLCDPLLWYAPG